MAGEPDVFRLSMAALEVPAALRDAVDELCANRFTPQDLCIAGLPAAIGSIRSVVDAAPKDSGTRLSSLLGVEPLGLVGGSTPILATSNRLLTSLKNPLPGAPGASSPSAGTCWLPPPMRAKLLDHMLTGDVMLLAGPVSRDQWVLGTRVLLRHSRHPVQSYEFSRPRVP